MPLRDDRRGRRATLMGNVPFRAVFPRAAPAASERTAETQPRTEAENEVVVSEHSELVQSAATRGFSAFSLHVFGSALGIRKKTKIATDPSSEQAEVDSHDDDVEPAAFAEELEAARARDIEPEDEFEAPPSTQSGATPADEPDRHENTDVIVHNVEPLALERSRPPLTRLPLRHVPVEIRWTSLLPDDGGAGWSEQSRHAFLRHCATEPKAHLESALRSAYSEEDARGRILALKALARGTVDGTRDTFVAALAHGTDDERAFAVDVFAERGERAQLIDALGDRVDAIAARAALSLVGMGTRIEFETALAPLVDSQRLATILGLLAAVMA